MEVTALEKDFSEKQILKSYGVPDDPRKIERPQPGSHTDAYPAGTGTYSCRVSKRISLPYGLEAVRTYDGVILRKKIQQKPGTEGRKEQEIPLPATSEEVETPFGRFTIKVFFLFRREDFRKKVYEMV